METTLTVEQIESVLENLGETGFATVKNGGLYHHTEENSDERYDGAVDEQEAKDVLTAWYSGNGNAFDEVASADDFNGCDPVDASDRANWPETGDDEPVEPSEIVRYTSPDKPAITVAVYREAFRAAVRWNDGWHWTDIDSGETTRDILARYLAGDMQE